MGHSYSGISMLLDYEITHTDAKYEDHFSYTSALFICRIDGVDFFSAFLIPIIAYTNSGQNEILYGSSKYGVCIPFLQSATDDRLSIVRCRET